MSDNPIRFGTSGWRGVIAEDFTFANVRLTAAGIAHYLLSLSAHPRVVVGYDTRFLSERFAEAAVEILGSHGVESRLCGRPEPTPALAYEIIHSGLHGGLNFTASHNPAEYNGLKFSSADGAPALPEVTREIERLSKQVAGGHLPLRGPQDDPAFRQATDPLPAYYEALKQLVDLQAIAEARLKVAYDPLYGTGRGYLNRFLEEAGVSVRTIHDFRDVLFSGVGPEPSAENLEELARLVREEKFDVGLSTDGDGDRYGIVDADGTWIHPNYVLALLADYLIEVRQMPGGLGRTVATTHLVDSVASYHGVPVYQTPVGFKYIGELIKEGKVAIAGEESAGLSIRGHLPEKDGILACLLVAEMVAKRGRSVKQQLEALYRKVGPWYTVRVNLALTPEVKERLLPRLARDWTAFDGETVVRIDRTDGLKLIREDGSWVLMRPSGTEPVVRVYCEAPSEAELERLVHAAKALVFNP